MKQSLLFGLLALLTLAMPACKAKHGCPSNGRNVGAEKLLNDDAKTKKLVKKAGKFKA